MSLANYFQEYTLLKNEKFKGRIRMTTDILSDCRLYATCSKQIQSKINKGGCIWNQGGVFGLHKWKLSCIFVIFKTYFH